MNDTTKKTQKKICAVTVRLEPDVLHRLDKLRGNRSRQYMLSGAVDAIISGLIDVPANRVTAVVCN